MWGRGMGYSGAPNSSPNPTIMKVTEEEVLEFRKLYLDHESVLLSDTEAREMLGGLCFLFERFATWLAKEKAAGREFPLDEPPHAPEGNEWPQ